MLYNLLKFLMRITTKIFFRSITIRNKEIVPSQGPLMVLANHPSTFMDPIVVATILNRKVYFLAKGELFKTAFTRWLLPKFNMIPVYRKQDDPSLMNKNEETFNKCFEHLEKGGVILMFPEGISITERKLKPIKTGAARIVLGAEARNNFQLNVKIINIGLNYEDPHKFNKDVFININPAIEAKKYQEEYKNDPIKAVQELTTDITKELERLVIDIEDTKTDALVKDIEQLYKYKLSKELGIHEDDKSKEFLITKNIIETVNYYKLIQPKRVEDMKTRLKNYFDNLAKIGLSDKDISNNANNGSFFLENIRSLITIIAGFPLYLYGLINNFLPFEIPGFIARKTTKSIEFRGAIGMVGGMFTFLIFHTLQIFFVWKYTHLQWLTALYAISLPISGLFTYWYYHTVLEIKNKWALMMIFYKKSVFIANLISEREQIISEFDAAKNEYAQTLTNT
ncbi:MAG: 1-acyl-sn-glycerol-3-phosphate acyltransferase [Bacteroidetes bacterium]|nr:1-acyl-sn-glycerol-3-phosphate acyltransferase [Bacteroidota bacterium]